MDNNHQDEQRTPVADTGAAHGRRKFLRQAGMTAAATAALVGVADVAGVAPAFASAKGPTIRKATALSTAKGVRPGSTKQVQEIRATATAGSDPFFSCILAPGHCNGNCTPNGVFCHHCCTSATHDSCAFICVGGDSNFFVSF